MKLVLRRERVLGLVIGITVNVITVIVLWHLGIIDLSHVPKLSISYLILAYMALLTHWILIALRARILVKTLGSHITLLNALKVNLSSLYLSLITPTYFGGEPLRVYLYSRYGGISYGEAVTVAMWEIILDTTGLCILSLLAFTYLRSFFSISSFFMLLTLLVFVTPTALLYLTVYRLLNEKTMHKIIGVVRKLAEKVANTQVLKNRLNNNDIQKVMSKVELELDSWCKSLRSLLQCGAKVLTILMVLTIAHWINLFTVAYFLISGLDPSFDFILNTCLQVLLHAVLAIPILPGGSGLFDISFVVLYSMWLGREVVGSLLVWWRIITYYTPLVLSGFFFVKVLAEVGTRKG